MATRKKKRSRMAVTSEVRAPKPSKVKIKLDPLEDLEEAIRGDDGVVEVLRFSSEDVIGHVKRRIPSGCLALDKLVGGGLPSGRIVEIYGAPSAGKTTCAQHVMANTQAMGGVVMLYETENKMDLVYAKACGVDVDRLITVQPEGGKTIEAGIAAVDRALTRWIESGREMPLTIVWDSVAATGHSKEVNDTANKEPGVPAREWRRAMRVLGEKVARAGALLLLINQQYEVIGGFGGFNGPRKSTYGGGGIRYHSSLRIEFVYTGPLKLGSGVQIGIEGEVRVFKNSLGIPGKDGYAIAYLRGFDTAWTLLEKFRAAGVNLVKQHAGTYTYADESRTFSWQGGFAGLDQLMRADEAARQPLADEATALRALKRLDPERKQRLAEIDATLSTPSTRDFLLSVYQRLP